MKKYRNIAVLLLVALLAAACGGEDDNLELIADEVECSDAEAAFNDAQAMVAEAEAELADAEGSRGEDEAEDALAEVQQYRDDVAAKHFQCVAEGSGRGAADPEAAAAEFLNGQGFTPDQYRLGDEASLDGATEERGDAAFSQKTLKTQADVAEFLNGDSEESRAARQRVEEALKDRPGELERALSGEGYLLVEFTVAVQYFGTTYFEDGKIIEVGNARQTKERDGLWLFITKDEQIVKEASIRADCGNPDFDRIVPVPPGTPPETPIECVEDCKPPDDRCRVDCEPREVKDPSEDSAQEAATPGVTGPGCRQNRVDRPCSSTTPPPDPPASHDPDNSNVRLCGRTTCANQNSGSGGGSTGTTTSSTTTTTTPSSPPPAQPGGHHGGSDGAPTGEYQDPGGSTEDATDQQTDPSQGDTPADDQPTNTGTVPPPP